MEIVVGKLAGFCAGVKNTVNQAEEILKENENVYCLGEIIHNSKVIEELENKGMITINNIEEALDGSIVIFRAHGEPIEVYKRAEEKNLKIMDLTCPRVKIIHDKVQKYKDKAFIIIVGKPLHPEIIATKSFAGENCYIIETEDDILDAYMEYEETSLGLVYIVSQTTFSNQKFDSLVEEIKHNFYEVDCIVDKTICMATEERQKETSKIAKEVDKMIIIGGKNSSNTKELAKVAEENCKTVYLIETVEELNLDKFSKEDKVGIMAGASTPKKSIDEVVEALNNINNI